MSWTLLPTDYTDAVWSGLKRYTQIDNSDGTVSFNDVTTYTNKEKSFFGAKDANRMNEAMNLIMSTFDIDGSGIVATVNTYTSFSGNVVSDGTLTVTKKFGMCFINGGITLSNALDGWVALLGADEVPENQNGQPIYATLPSWKAPTTNPARLRIPVGGGLEITRGSANAFWINLAYPIV